MCVWNTVVDRSNATRNGLIILEPVGGANGMVGGATWLVGSATCPVCGANELLGGATELVGGAKELVGRTNCPVGGAIVSTLTLSRDLSRTLVVLRSHNSAGDSSTLMPASHKHQTFSQRYYYLDE